MKIIGQVQPKTVTFKTKDVNNQKKIYKWWMADDEKQLCQQLLTTVSFLKETQNYRQRQAGIFARLYGNLSLFSFIGSNINKMDQMAGLPVDRPTFNLIQSCIDTLVSRLGQNRPAPVFLTDDGDYKERRLAKQLNNFILGEFYQTRAYEKAVLILRDALIMGTGVLKVFKTKESRVGIERKLLTELFTDPNESLYGEPRSIYEVKLVDRDVLMGEFPKFKKEIEKAEQAYPDQSSDSSKAVSDMVMVVEGFHLPSDSSMKDGRHTIACSAGVILDEPYAKTQFPYIILHYSPRLLGFWAQGLAEQLMGTQVEINSILFTISKSIKLTGVPRVFVEEGSKVLTAALNNDIGTIIKFRGTKPIYEVSNCVPPELYSYLESLIVRGYNQSGVSSMQAASKMPEGIRSGAAIRSYDDISVDRFATLSKKYDQLFIDLAYAVTDLAKDIAEEEGKYQTVYPNKDGTKEIDLPKMSLIKDPFIIQCFNMSSLPKDPAGRMEKVTEMVQAGMISLKEGRRLLDYPDLEQMEKLANASEERIFQVLDAIIENGHYSPPDPFMDLELATELCVQYYNRYLPAKLEDSKASLLRKFFSQIQTLKQQAQGLGGVAGSIPQQVLPPPPPQARPEPQPQSPLIPNATPGTGIESAIGAAAAA